MRRAAKKDANHDEFVEMATGAGLSVAETYQLGDGFVDIVVGGVRYTDNELASLLVEIKPPGEENDVTPKEKKFETGWFGTYMRTSEPRDVLLWFGRIYGEFSEKCVVHE